MVAWVVVEVRDVVDVNVDAEEDGDGVRREDAGTGVAARDCNTSPHSSANEN